MSGPQAARLTCLLVDDREENLLALSELVRRDDVDIVTARSGTEALEVLLAHDVALALIDVQMPEMDGFELAELMRGSERTRAVPIIFITAGAHDLSRVTRAYRAGAVDFLYKPIEPAILAGKLDVFFELQRQRLELDRRLAERTETLRLHEMFTAVLGHDLRSPLSAMLLGAEVIRRRSDDAGVQQSAERIAQSGRWMGRLISDMLDLARARLAGGFALERRTMTLTDAVAGVLDDLRARYPDREVEVATRGDVMGEWDADRLSQVAANLVGNALQHGEDGAPVRVSIDGGDSLRVSLSVENRGSIPPDLLEHVFDPFRGTSNGRKQGLGLGLFIVKEIVRAHGGRTRAEVTGDGGTRFVVELPRRGRAVGAAD